MQFNYGEKNKASALNSLAYDLLQCELKKNNNNDVVGLWNSLECAECTMCSYSYRMLLQRRPSLSAFRLYFSIFQHYFIVQMN